MITDAYLYEDVHYDIASSEISVSYSGDMTISGYFKLNETLNYAGRTNSCVYVNSKMASAYTKKTVEMIGRTIRTTIHQDTGDISVYSFVSKLSKCVFFEYTFTNPLNENIILLGFGNSGLNRYYSVDTRYDDSLDDDNLYLFNDNKERIRFVLAFDDIDTKKELDKFDYYLNDCLTEIEEIRLPKSVKSEQDKAEYYSAYFCTLENYRSIDWFKAFTAGLIYINPLRTYYRDSYFTVLSMYKHHEELIKDQIKALSIGIREDGTCPSAVKYDKTAFWMNHFDSPSLYVMQIFDYINHIGDEAILDERYNSKTVLENMISVMDKLIEFTDSTGLVYKPGTANKRDWADAVNRNGYSTYVESLYIRALECLVKVLNRRGIDSKKYETLRIKALKSLNEILYDEKLGYFVNFKSNERIETNLSIDTIFVILFKQTSKERIESMLDNMENMLESRNNKLLESPEYGVLCVYPFYDKLYETTYLSNLDYLYHNGSNWPFLSNLYAYTRYLNGRDGSYALKSWFKYNIKKGHFTPIEMFSPCRRDGSLLQAWSGNASFVFDHMNEDFFEDKYYKEK